MSLSCNCFVISNLVAVFFQGKEQRSYVLNEKTPIKFPIGRTKNANIHLNLQRSSAKYVTLKRRLYQHLIAVNLNIYCMIYWHVLIYSLGNLITVFSLRYWGPLLTKNKLYSDLENVKTRGGSTTHTPCGQFRIWQCLSLEPFFLSTTMLVLIY